jgi:HD-like signal output (HDOD) protein
MITDALDQIKPMTRMSVAEEIVSNLRTMPPSPPVAFKLFFMLKNRNLMNSDVVDVIRHDPDLTAQILRLSNSASFHGEEPIGTLEDAVLRLGYNLIQEKVMAITFGQLSLVSLSDYGVDPVDLWRHSIKSALAAKILAPMCTKKKFDTNTAYVSGLLHDIGKSVLNVTTRREVGKIRMAMEQEGLGWSDAELLVLGADHAEIGGLLLERWFFPDEIVSAVRYHNDPELDPHGVAKLIHVASACARCSDHNVWDEEEFKNMLKPYSLDYLGLDIAAIEEVIGRVKDESRGIELFMSVTW